MIGPAIRTRQFRPLAGHFSLYRTYVLATSRLSAAQRRNIGLGDVMIWDTNRPYHYARWTHDRRLLMGGGDRRLAGGSRRAAFERATERLRQDFETWLPGLSTVDIDAAVGRAVCRDARQPALHRTASPISVAPVCARLRRQRAHVRIPRRPVPPRAVAWRHISRPLTVLVRTIQRLVAASEQEDEKQDGCGNAQQPQEDVADRAFLVLDDILTT